MRLGAGRESGNFLVPDMDPLDLALPAKRVGQPIEAVADYAVYPLDTGRSEGFCELISDGLCHASFLWSGSCRAATNFQIGGEVRHLSPLAR